MKTCSNTNCKKQFEPTRDSQRFCCRACYKAEHQRQRYWADPAAGRAIAKKSARKAMPGRYKSGRLPKWMYS